MHVPQGVPLFRIRGIQSPELIREILIENRKIDDKRTIFGDKIVEILQKKYYCDGKYTYGKKMLP